VANDVLSAFEYGAYGGRKCSLDTSGHEPCLFYPSFGYTGQYQDNKSGLVYLRARYYQPQSQQFITRDPMEGSTGQPYGYAYSNPINVVDPTGLDGWGPPQIPPGVGGIFQLLGRAGSWMNSVGGEGTFAQGRAGVGSAQALRAAVKPLSGGRYKNVPPNARRRPKLRKHILELAYEQAPSNEASQKVCPACKEIVLEGTGRGRNWHVDHYPDRWVDRIRKMPENVSRSEVIDAYQTGTRAACNICNDKNSRGWGP
jgi:RHS repeat-associated protein